MIKYQCERNKNGSDIMNYKKQIENYLKESSGIITTSYCRNNNIPTVYLSRLVAEGKLINVEKGLYITEEGNYDEFYFFQYRFKKTVFSYETALFLLGLTDKIPEIIDVTTYNSYKFNSVPEKVNIYYVNNKIYDLGIIKVKTMYGNLVRVYSYERILCDFIAHKEKMDKEVYVKLIRSYSKYEKKDIHSLYKIASEMNVEKRVKDVMEVYL